MTRWPLLLALPYVVTVSTMEFRIMDKDGHVKDKVFEAKSIRGFKCPVTDQDDCNWLYDLAEAMNEAHRRRNGASYHYELLGPCQGATFPLGEKSCVD